MYKRHVRFTKDVKTIPLTLGTPVPIGDWGKAGPTGFIQRMYLSNFTDGRIDILVNGHVVQSFLKEYIEIRKTLTTPSQRVLADTSLTVIPCSGYLPTENIEVLVEGQADGLIVEYIIVDAEVPRPPILIEQVQYATFQVNSGIPVRTEFLHEVKEIYIVCEGSKLNRIQFRMNEYTKFDEPAMYFNTVQPFDYHTALPPDGVYTYSFCMDPETDTYTGSIHMGRIQHQVFTFWGGAPTFTVRIYAISYNIIKPDGSLEFIDS